MLWFLVLFSALVAWAIHSLSRPQPKISLPRRFTINKLKTSYDFIVVGSGSAGSVLASRLAQHTNKNGTKFSVLLIEAGQECHKQNRIRKDGSWLNLCHTDVDWLYWTSPQKHLNNRFLPVNRGKTTGGCSSINAMMWVRGCREDYDGWAKAGNDGWDYDSLLPLFKSLEDYPQGNPLYRGVGGNIVVTTEPKRSKLTQDVIKAATNAGFMFTEDYNAERLAGASYTQESVDKLGNRCDTFSSFIEPLLESDGCTNLDVLSSALVRKVVFDEERKVKGVLVEVDGQLRQFNANLEVVLSAGAVGSPHLLLLSGIGPQAELERAKIPVVFPNDGVGQNYHDHIFAPCLVELKEEYKDQSDLKAFGLTLFYQSEWSKKHTPGCGPDMQILSVAGCSTTLDYLSLGICLERFGYFPPNTIRGRIFLNLLALVRKYGGKLLSKKTSRMMVLPVILNQPLSRGTLKLDPKNPHSPPVIDPNCLSHPADLERLLEGLRVSKEITSQEPLKDWVRAILRPTTWDAETLKQHCAKACGNPWHPVGGCKMGIGKDCVVDKDLCVKGVKGLRVADASIMPSVVSGNTNAPSMVIGAKAAQLILAKYTTTHTKVLIN